MQFWLFQVNIQLNYHILIRIIWTHPYTKSQRTNLRLRHRWEHYFHCILTFPPIRARDRSILMQKILPVPITTHKQYNSKRQEEYIKDFLSHIIMNALQWDCDQYLRFVHVNETNDVNADAHDQNIYAHSAPD